MTGRLLRVRGLVQGVGFRPYVWRLANELGLSGWVKNDGAGVLAAVDGENWQKFVERLPLELPPLARIDGIEVEPCEVATDGFAIVGSDGGDVRTAIGPDAAICPDCIADLCDPAGRRWRYAFTTCTHCGPRFTVSAGIPYDRARTSLAGFPLCPTCAAEYADPADRRFHAETTCCPECGPALRLVDAKGGLLAVDRNKTEKSLAPEDDPIAGALARLRTGNIAAIKGLGGFHLACDARNPLAVAELRRRKQRDGKPFAVMALNPASIKGFARVGDAEQALLNSVAAPIVLCPKGEFELESVAPGLGWLGVMRPATPLHLLLWHEAAGRPSGTDWLQQPSDLLLVMTSANPHGEPLATGNDEALARLGEIADAFLLHDRDIVVRCDDSVVRATQRGPAFLRRARGYTPLPVPLADDGPNVLALGGYLKNAICVTRGREAFLSQHVGGLDNAAALGFLEETVAHLLAILDVKPDAIAHDLHPDFPSTALALRLTEELSVPAIAVGHHQAHIAAICAEHALNGVVGLALDGVGLGPDGGAWGGELLRVEGAACERLGHLLPLKLPGGDRAAREPWRMAVSALHGAGLAHHIADWQKRTWPERDAGPLLTMLARDLRCPPTTSLGRWFDAVAGLLGVRDVMLFEGQAAMELEALAARHGAVEAAADGYALKDGVLDLSPLLPKLLDCRDAAAGSSLFHATLAAGLAEWATAAFQGEGFQAAVDRKKGQKIAIGGGCALNAILTTALRERLAASGIELLEARQAPANDGGLALGQAWVARHVLAGGHHAAD